MDSVFRRSNGSTGGEATVGTGRPSRMHLCNRSPAYLGQNEPATLVFVNPYADYARDLGNTCQPLSNGGGGGGNHYCSTRHDDRKIGFFNASDHPGSNDGKFGMFNHGNANSGLQNAHYPRGGSRGGDQLQQERNQSLNPMRRTQLGVGRSQQQHSPYSSASAGGSPIMNQPSERMLIPRKELEMLSRFGETGGLPGQLDSPHGFCLGAQGEIIIADTMNNRIQVFDQKGTLLTVWGSPGYRKGRLWQPRKVAYLEDSDRIVVSDRGRDFSRLQVFSRNGDFFSQIRQIRSTMIVGLTVYRGLVIAIENQPSSCVVINQLGKILFHFTLEGVMEEPSDVLVVSEMFYICDFLGHCVGVFDKFGKLLQRIGNNFPGIIFFPNGIDVAESGDVIVADTHGNRFHVSVWSPDGKLLADYELPHMKVSRCCGLFMTPEGNLVTAATNNNIVLVTNLLRVPGSSSPPLPLAEWI